MRCRVDSGRKKVVGSVEKRLTLGTASSNRAARGCAAGGRGAANAPKVDRRQTSDSKPSAAAKRA